jgi:hypothetical protein
VRAAVIPLLSVASWLGVVQAAPASLAPDGIATTVGVASVLGTLTVLVYRLGVWRQEMENTKHNIGAEVKQHGVESSANFGRLERRLEAIDRQIAHSTSQRVRAARWQARTERRLDQLEAAAGTEVVP